MHLPGLSHVLNIVGKRNAVCLSIVVKLYTSQKADAALLIELVEKIEVYHAEKIDGVKTQRVVIYYNCIGCVDIPEQSDFAELQITLETRKGVTVNIVRLV